MNDATVSPELAVTACLFGCGLGYYSTRPLSKNVANALR
jgi:hypothetical protein